MTMDKHSAATLLFSEVVHSTATDTQKKKGPFIAASMPALS